MRSEKQPTRLQPQAAEAKTATATTETRFNPVIKTTPALPAIDWDKIGAEAPTLLDSPADELPQADTVIITWAGAEWAALEHVFCSSSSPMPYSDRSKSYWDGWQKYDKDMPEYSGSDGEEWSYWGYYRLAEIQGSKVLLFKSNTHLDWPGEQYLEDLIYRLIDDVSPRLLLSIGTAGGARTTDHLGTVNVVRAGTLYEEDEPSSKWPVYSNDWDADWATIKEKHFKELLFPVPTKKSDLQSLCEQFNKYYGTSYTLAQLNPGNLNMGNAQPHLNDMTPKGTSLLTTSTFVVATTDGNFEKYACVEMDDAVIAKVCDSKQTAFGFVRNLSDPVQNAALPQKVQGNWGSAIYSTYGLYTSYNGALATWAIVNAQGSK
jgi:hypothetical protein